MIEIYRFFEKENGKNILYLNWIHLSTEYTHKIQNLVSLDIVLINKNGVIFLRKYIKNMVCLRCQMVAKSELEKLGLHYIDVKIGEANIIEQVLPEQLEQLDISLR